MPRAGSSASGPASSSRRAEANVYVKIGDKMMSMKELREITALQRGTNNLYKPEVFFPGGYGRQTATTRESVILAPKYICYKNYGCEDGACAFPIDTVDVKTIRENTVNEMGSFNISLKQYVMQHIKSAWNATTQKWSRITVHTSPITSVELCITSWALVHGFCSSTLQNAASDIMLGEYIETPEFYFTSAKDSSAAKINNHRRTMDFMMLREYVRELVYKHEMNPAPGAACRASGETYVSKRSWKHKWEDCKAHFRAHARQVPGSQSMLKTAWKQETRLKERVSKSHSKCNICSTIDAQLYKLKGMRTAEAKQTSANLQRARQEHEESHLRDRAVLDAAAYRAILEPNIIWTILADAATERTMTLPRLKRRSKSLSSMPFFKQKLMATYAYGYGFVPFLVHESQKFGANLTFTVLWLTMTRMYKERRRWPQELHLTIDNTTGENKNFVMIAFCSWLVKTGKVKRVRVFFLKVGHTHVIIDQIFGVITVALRGQEVLLPQVLKNIIDETGKQNPHWDAHPVTFLHSLFDMTTWVREQMDFAGVTREFKSRDVDEAGQFNGMYDFFFRTHSQYGVSMQYREDVAFPIRPEHAPSGCETIRATPTTPPPLAEMKCRDAWARVQNTSIEDTIVTVSLHAITLQGFERDVFVESWREVLSAFPDKTDDLLPGQKLKFEFLDTSEDLEVLEEAVENQNWQTPETPEKVYEEFKRRVLNIRDKPFAIDPVISSEQTLAQFEKAKRAMRATIREGRGPTVNKLSPVLDGDLVLAKEPASPAVSLYKVEGLATGHTPYTTDLHMVCLKYDHTPKKKDVKWLDGTFAVAKVQGKEVKRTLLRRDVVVFNVELVPKECVLNLASLRALALALPEVYTMPDEKDIGEEHLGEEGEEEPEKPKRRGQHRAARPKEALNEDDNERQEDSADSSSEDEAEAEQNFLDEDLTGKLVFVLVNENAKVCPALVVSDDRDSKVNVRWYAASSKWRSRNGSRPPKNEKVVYEKFWTDPSWTTREKIAKKDRRPDLLPQHLVEEYWYKQEIERSAVLDIEFPNSPELESLWKTDAVSVSYEFYEKNILPIVVDHEKQ